LLTIYKKEIKAYWYKFSINKLSYFLEHKHWTYCSKTASRSVI